jgi:hypothetical protein
VTFGGLVAGMLIEVNAQAQGNPMHNPSELSPQEIWESGAGPLPDANFDAGRVFHQGMMGMATGYTIGAFNAGVIAPIMRAGDWAQNLARVNSIREAKNVKKGQNIGFADFNIEGTVGESIGVSGRKSPSGTAPVPENRFFTTYEVGGYSREFDTEVKILEEIAHKFANQPGTYNNIRGQVNLFSERPPCESCQGVIQQFQQMFPNIQVIVNSGPGQ